MQQGFADVQLPFADAPAQGSDVLRALLSSLRRETQSHDDLRSRLEASAAKGDEALRALEIELPVKA